MTSGAGTTIPGATTPGATAAAAGEGVPAPRLSLQAWCRQIRSRLHWRRSRSRYPRLTVASQYFPPDFAATGQLLHDLVSRLARDGVQVQVLTGQPAYAYSQDQAPRLEFRPNLCVRRTRASQLWPTRIRGRAVNGLLYCLRVCLRLLRYSRRGDLLLYTTEPAYLPLLGWLLHRLTGTPYLLLLYDLYPDVLVELKVLPESHPLVRLWRTMHRWACHDAQEVIVLSEPMARRVRQHYPQAANRVHVIPSWADPDLIRPLAKAHNPFVARHGLEQRFTVLYSGNQGRCHDLVTLLAAALLLRHEHDILFLFIGAGAQHQRLRSLVTDWNLGNCRFLPYQEPEVLPHSLPCGDIAVVSLGIEAEGLVAPSKLYGHLAAGTPIAAITPPGSALQELVQQSGCGQWFANGDADHLAAWIRHLRDDPAEARACGQAARHLLMDTATPDHVARCYLELIRRHLPHEKPLRPLTTPVSTTA